MYTPKVRCACAREAVCVNDVGSLNLKDAANMETTEQQFTQIRAERKKRSRNQREGARTAVGQC